MSNCIQCGLVLTEHTTEELNRCFRIIQLTAVE
jgi:hypothetical protein